MRRRALFLPGKNSANKTVTTQPTKSHYWDLPVTQWLRTRASTVEGCGGEASGWTLVRQLQPHMLQGVGLPPPKKMKEKSLDFKLSIPPMDSLFTVALFLFWFGWVSLLPQAFSSCGEGATLCCGSWTSHWHSFYWPGAQAPEGVGSSSPAAGA